MRSAGRGAPSWPLALGQCDGERLQALLMVTGRLLDGPDPVHGGDGDRIEAVAELRRRRSLRPATRQEGADGVWSGVRDVAGSPRRPGHRTNSWIKPSMGWHRTAGSSRCGWPCSPRWLKGKPWTPATLKEVGGTEGSVSRSSKRRSARPPRRVSHHQKAAQSRVEGPAARERHEHQGPHAIA